MASPTQWTWVWVNSRSWWWIGKPGMLRFIGSQRVRHNWVTELNWTSAYLRLLIFLLAILILACVSSNPAFLMMYSAYKLNKQSDNIQPWHTPFPIWNQSVVPCPVLTVASWPAYRYLRRQVRWSGIPSLYEEIKNICIFQIHSISNLEDHEVLIENSHFTKDGRQ